MHGGISPMPQPSAAALQLLEDQQQLGLKHSPSSAVDKPSSPSLAINTVASTSGATATSGVTATSTRSTQKQRQVAVRNALQSVVNDVQADLSNGPQKSRPVKVRLKLGTFVLGQG